ncbi:MAG: formylglycine-generating enzyme family protein, partial [Sandaracinaceae bacterium]
GAAAPARPPRRPGRAAALALARGLAGCVPASGAGRDARSAARPGGSAETGRLPKQAGDPCAGLVGPDGMACVPGGSFVRGRDDGPAEEAPAARVTVSTFFLMRDEVTQQAYRACVEAGVCGRAPPYRGYLGPRQPAVGMTWADADTYCRREGWRLPTEAEWERAAGGPPDTRFPWGDEVPSDPCERAIVRTRAGRGCGRGTTWDVGSRPPGPWGLRDMAGNVWEWVADHGSACYRGCRRSCDEACEGVDPRGLCGGGRRPCPAALGQRLVRGGSWWHPIERATVTARRSVPGANPTHHRFGFRCAADAPGPRSEES